MDAEIIESNKKDDAFHDSDITIFNVNSSGPNIEFQKITTKPNLKSVGIQKYGSLCNELKELYTAVTRARKRLIIYDENPKKGKELKKIWRQLELTEYISDQDFQVQEEHVKN